MSQQPLLPRNYFPLAVSGTPLAGSLSPHDRLHPRLLNGSVELEIEALSPLHVGCGSFGLAGDQAVKELVERDGVPVVPGTSIKGICRQAHEVLTQSRSPFDETLQHGRRRGGEAPPLPSYSGALFGLLGFHGRVSFDDAVPREPFRTEVIRLSVPYPPRDPVGRRFYGSMPEGARQPQRIPARALATGTRLVTTLRFRNVQEAEIGSVLLALGVGRFTPKLGGGKYDPYGWVRIRPLRYRLRQGLTFEKRPWIEEVEAVKAFCDGAIAAIDPLLPPGGRTALAKLVKEMKAPAQRLGGEK